MMQPGQQVRHTIMEWIGVITPMPKAGRFYDHRTRDYRVVWTEGTQDDGQSVADSRAQWVSEEVLDPAFRDLPDPVHGGDVFARIEASTHADLP